MVRCAGSARPTHRSRRARAATNSPSKKRVTPCSGATQQLRRGIVPRLADLFELLAQRERQPVLGSHAMKRPLATISGTRCSGRSSCSASARARARVSPHPPPTSLSWQSMPMRARFAGPVPVAGAMGRPADRPARSNPFRNWATASAIAERASAC